MCHLGIEGEGFVEDLVIRSRGRGRKQGGGGATTESSGSNNNDL
jgi:hypothetical protein